MRSVRVTAIVLTVWVALVLGHEAWATLDPTKRILWLAFSQKLGGDLELFPWITWGLLPAAFAYGRHGAWLDGAWFGVSRWTRGDRLMLLSAAVVAVFAVGVVRLVPSLTENYRTLSSYGSFAADRKAQYFVGSLFWILSWLPLWEFMTRGMLLPFVDQAFPRHGWLAVPVLETAFHLVKPWPETLGMLVFSVIATRWTMKRRNLLLPFLAHLSFELAVFGYVAYG